MSLELTDHVRTALFAKIEVEEYFTGTGYGQQILAFSDHMVDYTISGTTFTALGQLVNITSSVNELRASTNPLTITVSGIPDSSINAIVNSKLKGSRVTVYRGYFQQNGNSIIGVDTIVGRYSGFVNNYSLVEEYNNLLRTATNTIQIECSNFIDLLDNKVSGRRTNSSSQNRFYPNDRSFDRVPVLANTELYVRLR